jgi:4'-phosphopantetheinyl transferase
MLEMYCVPQESRSDTLSATIDLAAGEIHLWLAFYDQLIDERVLERYREILSAVEREREQRFHFYADRQRYLVTRALVRTVLSRYAAIEPNEWIFSANEYGRPEIGSREAQSVELSFNISHTHSLIILGVTRRRALGVDVENVFARQVSLDIADRFFSPDEAAALAALPTRQQRYRFFEYWTFKESYIKARGIGLSLPLDRFSFEFPDEGVVSLAIHSDLADDPARWQFWQFQPTPKYLVAVCAERADAASSLTVRTVRVGSSDEIVRPTILRISR